MISIYGILICYFGIVLGAALAFIAPEELKEGRQYFNLFQHALAGAFAFFAIIGTTGSIIYSLIAFVLASLASSRLPGIIRMPLSYLVFTISLFFTHPHSHPILYSIIFIYGFPTGSIIRSQMICTSKRPRRTENPFRKSILTK